MRTPNKPRPKRAKHSSRVEEFEYFSPEEETPEKNILKTTPRHKNNAERTPGSSSKVRQKNNVFLSNKKDKVS